MTLYKNKLLSVTTLLTLVMIPVFIAVFFLAQQCIIRHEMKEQLEQQSLETIRIAEKNVSWVEKGRELIVDGKLFDVKSFKKTDGYIEATGLFDEKELSLQHKLIYLQNPLKDNKQKQDLIYQILIQQQAEKTRVMNLEIFSFENVFNHIPSLPDIKLRDPFLLLIAKPPDNIG